MDSFSILGLAPDASFAEIKRAYRRMAMVWHPDRSSHPEATERFKLIRAAYEALQDRSKMEGESDDATDEAAPAARATDIRLDFEVSLEEAAFGCEKKIAYDRGVTCATCSGSGEAGISRSRPCHGCYGSGRIRDRHWDLEICPGCGGRGFLNERICPGCGGRGEQTDRVNLHVMVPAGMLHGDELRLAGQGGPGIGGLSAGDLFLRLIIRPHALFKLRGRELSYAMPINSLILLAGGNVQVPVLGGTEMIEVAAGEVGPRTIRLPGRGYPGRCSVQPGDLFIDLQPVMPRSLSSKQKRQLREVVETCEGDLDENLPEIAVWRRRNGL